MQSLEKRPHLPGEDASLAIQRVAAGQQAAIFHDYFAIRGGGERLVLTLAAAQRAPVTFGYRTAESYDADMFQCELVDLDLPAYLRHPAIRQMALAARFRGRRVAAASSGTRIFSGTSAVFAAPPRSARARNIYYCHTPPRSLFDQRDRFLAHLHPAGRAVAGPLLRAFEAAYRRAVDRMDVIVANSQTTRARIRQFLGRDSIVVHPPADVDRFTWRGQGGYYLSTARLSGLKRVDRIVEAFLAMPDKQLLVVSGGEDRAALERRAANAPNIRFLGWVGDDELQELVGNAIATIYLPVDEDFGMSPVESMAAGKPVIGVAAGGLTETILPGETGLLLSPEFSIADLVAAVRQLTPERALAMREVCEWRAGEFSRDRFLAGMQAILDRARREIGSART